MRFVAWVAVLSWSAAAPLTFAADDASGVYNAKNITLQQGRVQAGESGAPFFGEDFESISEWSVSNYRDLLSITVEKGDDGQGALRVARDKPIDPNDPEGKDTAWGILSPKQSLKGVAPESRFVLRMETSASKPINGGGSDGQTYRGAIDWFSSEGEILASTPFLFKSGYHWNEENVTGEIPKDADSFTVRMGFDVPNLEPGEFALIRGLSFEILDPNKTYVSPGSFTSGIFEGGDVSWNADAPEGTKVQFQVAIAEADGDEPGEFSAFVGPDGTSATYYERPFHIDAPYVRYRATLVPNGIATPTLISVTVGSKTDSAWKLGGDFEPPLVQLYGAYAVPSRDRRAPLGVRITDASIIRRSSVKITVDEVDVTQLMETTRLDDGALLWQGTLEDELTDGLHKVVVDASDIFDNSYASTRYFLIGDAPTTPKITLREDGTTLIDGVPFFPIGIYGVCEREFNGFNIDEAFRGLKEAGFNFAHSYSMPREDKFLQAAEKYGFKLWSVIRFPDERFVEIERRSPAILAWYLGDDTSYNTKPNELYDYFYSVKAVDPTRLTVQADPIDALKEVSNYRPYVTGTDAFLPETYPVRKDVPRANEACVAQAVLDVKRSRSDAAEANDGPKAVWPIIQYFQGWGWERFPTYRELRAMSFGVLAAGANGITWYTYGGTVEPEKKKFNYGVTTSPDRWSNICKIATQINELSPVLLELTDVSAQPKANVVSGPKKDPYGGDSVVCLLKRHEGKNYLIAVNASPEPVSVEFVFPESPEATSLEVLFDEKSLAHPTFKDGVIREELGGFDTRVYRW